MENEQDLYVYHYKYKDDMYIETIRERRSWEVDAWLCDNSGEKKQFITSFSVHDDDWMEKIEREIEKAS